MGRQEKDGSGFSEFVFYVRSCSQMFSLRPPITLVMLLLWHRDGHYADAPVISGIKAARVYISNLARRYSNIKERASDGLR